ncbi:hypothetical protein C0992_002425 [Termitomyces sp. T32_za158]|nr:hypothetical protein C0992_002425 [Termitomyces sp. T32_za158]
MPKIPHPNSEVSVEEDIVDQLCTVDLNEEMPARPSSRLGFNCDAENDPPLTAEEPYGRVYHESFNQAEEMNHWTKLDEYESDITMLIPERDEIPTRPRSPGLVEDWALHYDQSMSENEDLDRSSGEGFDEDYNTSLSHAASSPPLDEIVRSFSQPIEPSDWSISPKFSCLPSPLSSPYVPFNASSYNYTPQRHRYRHHGHSRHALLHLKWFWASREDTWLECNARMFKVKAYDGLSILNSVSPRFRLPGGCIPHGPADTPQPPPSPPIALLPPLSVHPRRGDLSALHDPYCMHIDRYFVGMPLWTMSKTLWMFDVHMASGELQAGQQDVEDDLFEYRSEGGSIETSESHAFSDDSDSTLVESDHEAEQLRDAHHNQEDIRLESKGSQTPEHDADASSSKIPIMRDLKRFIPPRSTSTNSNISCPPPWPTNWYRRWEILLQLCVQNKSKTIQPSILPISHSKPQRFFIGDDWDEEEDEEAEEQGNHALKKNVFVVVNDDCSSGRHLRHCF